MPDRDLPPATSPSPAGPAVGGETQELRGAFMAGLYEGATNGENAIRNAEAAWEACRAALSAPQPETEERP